MLDRHAAAHGAPSLASPSVNLPVTESPQTGPLEPDPAQWFASEVHAHDESLKSYLRRAFPAVRDVEDVVQESYLRVWRRQLSRPLTVVAGSVNISVKGFLFQVARRLALDTLRRAKTSPIDPAADSGLVADESAHALPRETVCTNEEFDLLLIAIEDLPGRCREVVVLRKLRGLSSAATAHSLGIAEDTVHVQTRRGLRRIHEFLRRRRVLPGGPP